MKKAKRTAWLLRLWHPMQRCGGWRLWQRRRQCVAARAQRQSTLQTPCDFDFPILPSTHHHHGNAMARRDSAVHTPDKGSAMLRARCAHVSPIDRYECVLRFRLCYTRVGGCVGEWMGGKCDMLLSAKLTLEVRYGDSFSLDFRYLIVNLF